jgi:hypothetical protein
VVRVSGGKKYHKRGDSGGFGYVLGMLTHSGLAQTLGGLLHSRQRKVSLDEGEVAYIFHWLVRDCVVAGVVSLFPLYFDPKDRLSR